MAKKIIAPAQSVNGTVALPGDKSISHRYAMLAAIAEGTSTLSNYAEAADCQSTLDCLKRLGIHVESVRERATNGSGANLLRIAGAGLHGLRRSRRGLDAGNSGTTMRLMAGVLAGQEFESTITGDKSLRRRPMKRVIEPLSKMGAEIRAEEGGVAPLQIRGTQLHGMEYEPATPSAQVKSCVLLAGLFAEGETTVVEKIRTRDHTELALEQFGVEVERGERSVSVRGGAELRGCNLQVPGDLSSAVFFIAAALILPDSSLALRDVGLNPTRTAILDVLAELGASISLVSVHESGGELVGDIGVRSSSLEGGVIGGAQVAQLIDELPMLAALAPFTEKGIEIRDAGELRVKESDRIAALAENLRRMGATVEECEDGLRIAGKSAGRLHGAEIEPRGDHRIAMAFSIAALGTEGQSTIRDAECAAVSFPAFFDTLASVTERD
ncbi:MAG TPA: 3-phosphoshikimate 1-carboxyvinyltransferase [Candidatus Acidoferrales bacterium]|nr:3-phosphoshikimate 1-carboxyvinyltransferase [Candidatus Acidoferrales bacterium]